MNSLFFLKTQKIQFSYILGYEIVVFIPLQGCAHYPKTGPCGALFFGISCPFLALNSGPKMTPYGVVFDPEFGAKNYPRMSKKVIF